MRWRDLEIRGAGNLLGGEQSGHIAAVGFEMYLRLLEEAVALAKGEKVQQEEQRPVIVELPVDAYLPPEYVMDEIERVDLYRRASGVQSLAEVDDLAEELTDRFGRLPDPTLNLLGNLAHKAPGAQSRRQLRNLPLRHADHLPVSRPRLPPCCEKKPAARLAVERGG